MGGGVTLEPKVFVGLGAKTTSAQGRLRRCVCRPRLLFVASQEFDFECKRAFVRVTYILAVTKTMLPDQFYPPTIIDSRRFATASRRLPVKSNVTIFPE